MVSHGFVSVNAHRVNIASFLVKPSDEITVNLVKDRGLKNLKENLEASAQRKIPGWLDVDKDNFKIKIVRLPQREDIEHPINEQLIVELYSR